MAKKCKPTLSDRCLATMNAKCVDYEGILREGSTLEEDGCITVEDVIEDIIVAVDQNTKDLDFTEFGCCIEYEVSDTDRGLTLKDVVGTHESMLCDIVKRLDGEEVQEGCTKCGEDSCEDDRCCEILKKFDSLTTPYTVNSVDWKNNISTELQYKATKSGIYKFTFELGVNSASSSSSFMAGLSLNGLTPESNLFSQVTVNSSNSNTVTFISKMSTNDTSRFATKSISGATYILDYVKVIVEKIK